MCLALGVRSPADNTRHSHTPQVRAHLALLLLGGGELRLHGITLIARGSSMLLSVRRTANERKISTTKGERVEEIAMRL